MLKVGFCIRGDVATRPGGDHVQAQKTAAALAEHSVAVQWVSPAEVPAADIDLLHVFNLTRLATTLEGARAARRRGLPYVLTPIWHELSLMQRFYAREHGMRSFPIRAYLALKEPYYERRISPAVMSALLRWSSSGREVVGGAALVLPNSPEEGETLCRELGVSPARMRVVPNGVDLSVRETGVARGNIVVCAGRVEPRKNTLSVVRAFLSSRLATDHVLVLLGSATPGHERYVAAVRALVDGKRVVWRQQVPFAEAQKVYASARVSVLASFFETTGLVGLEALYQGASVVMTRCGYMDYYYGDRVTYCDPYSEDSIRAAMEVAATRTTHVDPETFRRFSWQEIGRATAAGYREVLNAG